MTTTARVREKGEARNRAFSDRGPVAKSYRRFLGKSMLLMITLVIIGAYLLPLLYMVTTAFQQPGQSTTPGAPVWPAAPQTAEYEGEPYPVYTVPFPDGTTRQLILIEAGRESSVFVDPAAAEPDADRVAGPVADARAGVDVRAAGRELHAPPGTSSTSPGCCGTRSGSRS